MGAPLTMIMDLFGDPAIRTDAASAETSVRIILKLGVETLGDYGERAESRWTLAIPSATGAAVGDRYAVPTAPTDADPTPAPTTWLAVQLLDDDGLMRTFAARLQA